MYFNNVYASDFVWFSFFFCWNLKPYLNGSWVGPLTLEERDMAMTGTEQNAINQRYTESELDVVHDSRANDFIQMFYFAVLAVINTRVFAIATLRPSHFRIWFWHSHTQTEDHITYIIAVSRLSFNSLYIFCFIIACRALSRYYSPQFAIYQRNVSKRTHDDSTTATKWKIWKKKKAKQTERWYGCGSCDDDNTKYLFLQMKTSKESKEMKSAKRTRTQSCGTADECRTPSNRNEERKIWSISYVRDNSQPPMVRPKRSSVAPSIANEWR